MENKYIKKIIFLLNRKQFWFSSIYTIFSLFVLYAVFSFGLKNVDNGLKIEIVSNVPSFKLFYDTGNGFTGNEFLNSTTGKFELPEVGLNGIRIDPFTNRIKSTIYIKQICLTRNNGFEKIIEGELLTQTIKPINHIHEIRYDGKYNATRIEIDGNDPFFLIDLDQSEFDRINSHISFIQKVSFKNKIITTLLLFLFVIFWIFRKKIYFLLKSLNFFNDGSNKYNISLDELPGDRKIISRILDPFPSDKSYWVAFFIFALIYILTYINANSFLITYAAHDDALYYNLAKNISQLNWLGDYNFLTLAKVPGYAIFLSFCMLTGIPYLLLVSIFNTIAILFFLKCSMWIFKGRKLFSFLLGLSLLFNPIFASQLRIYRMQLPAIGFIIFVGVIISMFNPDTKRKRGFVKIIEALIAFIGFGFLFYSREESILYYGIFFIVVFSFLLVKKNIKHVKLNLFLPIVGFIGVFSFWVFISSMNYLHYGRFVICERTSAPFTQVIKKFQSIADPNLNPEYSKASATKEKILTIAKQVPSFNNVAQIMCDPSNRAFKGFSTYLDRDDLIFKTIGEDEIPTSHFEWFWIDSFYRAGYYKDALTLAKQYKKVDAEIELAVKKGLLEKREMLINIGPYFLNKTDLRTILRILPKNYKQIMLMPKTFSSWFQNILVKPIPVGNVQTSLIDWQSTLKLNYLEVDDLEGINRNENSFYNIFWNFIIKLFAYFILPLMHMVTPFAIITIFIALVRKEWLNAILLILISSSYILYFIMLSVVDVIAGFDSANMFYFLPAYASIIVNIFLVLNYYSKLIGTKKNLIHQ